MIPTARKDLRNSRCQIFVEVEFSIVSWVVAQVANFPTLMFGTLRALFRLKAMEDRHGEG